MGSIPIHYFKDFGKNHPSTNNSTQLPNSMTAVEWRMKKTDQKKLWKKCVLFSLFSKKTTDVQYSLKIQKEEWVFEQKGHNTLTKQPKTRRDHSWAYAMTMGSPNRWSTQLSWFELLGVSVNVQEGRNQREGQFIIQDFANEESFKINSETFW